MKRILYFGYMSSPFARTDAEMLSTMTDVSVINLSEMAARYGQLPTYVVRYFTQVLPRMRTTDIVWIWTADYFTLPIVLAGRLFGKRVVVHLGGYEIHNDPEIGYGNQRFLIRGYLSRWILKHCEVIVQSEAYVVKLTKLIPNVKLYMLPAAVIIPDVTRTKDDSVMTAYKQYTGAERIKGIKTFRDAVNQLTYRSTVMVDQPHEALMLALKQTKVYCQLSWTEHFGQVVLEAMSCGCIPVVSDRGNLPELIDGVGIVVPYGNAEQTRIAIRLAMNMNSMAAVNRARDYDMARKFANLSVIVESK
jgi:hypothetical protein